jgi:hypothetical protein
MSFPEYGQFPNAQQEGAPGSGPPPQDGSAPGQPTDPSAQQQMSFPTPDGNAAPQNGQGADGKTTLW